MSVETVKEYLKAYGRDGDVREFDISTATVELAAEAVGVIPARIAKSITLEDNGNGCIMIIAAGDTKIDNTKFKAAFGQKARMLNSEDVLLYTGHAVGGVCPFAITGNRVKVYLDCSLQRFKTVFPACGSSNTAIELTCDELFDISRAERWVDVCRLRDNG